MGRVCCGTLAAVTIVLLGATGVASAGVGRATTPLRITLDGVAGLTPGLTRAQAEHRFGAPLVLLRAKPGSNCRMARLNTDPLRGDALFLDGRLSALFFTAGVRTDRGIGIGSTQGELLKAYGSSHLIFLPAAVSLHVYTRARYLGDGRALRFDLDVSGHVVRIAVGGRALSRTTGHC